MREVRRGVRIPVAVKLSPFYTSFANFAHRLDAAGPAGLVLFNRFWQPGIDVEELEVRRELHLSDSSELPLRLRWLAILSGDVRAALAVTGGVHTVHDVIQAVMAGAHAVQMVSALLHHGPEYLAVLRGELAQWLEEHEYGSLREMRGTMSMRSCPDPHAYERANYILMLQSWKPLNGASRAPRIPPHIGSPRPGCMERFGRTERSTMRFAVTQRWEVSPTASRARWTRWFGPSMASATSRHRPRPSRSRSRRPE